MERLLFACLSLMACGSMASASDTVVRVEGGQLVVVTSDGTEIRCQKLTLSLEDKAATTLSVVEGLLQLESGDMKVQVKELRSPAPADKPAAK
jgi:opacity protein-like surface antigen